ncbi:hypothetical protein LZ016_13810 [Sphingomonas sp. SM33]|uniref:Uncharacterized protein n=1 Tax=Sphingomonas telluris TaxID=2907998 RepID=A0ABS9VRE4_9SPHN|nr:hypothetical protein [Sphingomonas telluris]MCH8617169.1 hypothetical protein [Sphingomonas telluris]
MDQFYGAVIACGRTPPFKPQVRVSAGPSVPHYDHEQAAVVLCPWEFLSPAQKAGMEASAKAGTLGLSPTDQYGEIFNELLVPHELAHWLQMVAFKPIDRWTAEYEANRIMVAYWREHPAPAPAASSEDRFINFSAHGPGLTSPVPAEFEDRPETYFNVNSDALEQNPRGYAWYQKMMVRRACAERPRPTFSSLVESIWPSA